MTGKNRITESEARRREAARRAAIERRRREIATENRPMNRQEAEELERRRKMSKREMAARQKAARKRSAKSVRSDDVDNNVSLSKKQLAKKKRKRKFKILLGVEIAVIVIAFLAVFGFLWIKSKYNVMTDQDITFLEADIATNSDIDSNAAVFSGKYTTFMLYGVDSRSNDTLVKDTNADTEIVVSLNNETGEISMVSIMRDTALQTSSGRYKKVTDSYCAYGVKESIEMMNRNLDLTITKYVTVNWKAVIDAINILGGIDVDIKAAEVSQINYFGEEANRYAGYSNYQNVSSGAGVKHLDGAQAVGFARIRNVNRDGDSDDFARTNRQRIVIEAMLKAAKSADLSTINKLIDEVMPGIATNITFEEAIGLASNMSSYKIANQGRFPFDYKSGQYDMLFPNTLSKGVSKLHEILYGEKNYQPSGTVNNISADMQYTNSN